MRRILAAVAALLMIAGGFGLWAVRTGRFSNDKTTSVSIAPGSTTPTDDAPLRIACIPEAENACGSIADPLVGFSIEYPNITEPQIAAKNEAAPDGWITTALSYERVRFVNDSFADAVDVASTRIMVVTRLDDANAATACKADLGCLALASKVSFPAVNTTGTGLSISTLAATASAGADGSVPVLIDDIPNADAIVAGLQRATKSFDPLNPLAKLTSIHLLDAVVLPEVRVRALRPARTAVVPTNVRLAIVLVLSKSISSERRKAIVKVVSDTLRSNGFDPPSQPRQVINATIANDLSKLLI